MQQVFAESSKLEKDEWMKQSHTSKFAWLFSLVSIREKVHSEAKVKQLHVNEREAQRLFDHLTNQ